MNNAISMYLGGEVIEPSYCDYADYKTLGLVCPLCRHPVFLRSGAEFQSAKGTRIKKKQHFAHFQCNLEEAQACEARALTKEGKKAIAAIANKSRQQRRKLFEEHFVDLFRFCLLIDGMAGDISPSSKDAFASLFARLDKYDCYKCFRGSLLEAAQKDVNFMREHKTRQLKNMATLTESSPAMEQLDLLIGIEVINYLNKACSISLYKQILRVYISQWMLGKVLEEKEIRGEKMLQMFVEKHETFGIITGRIIGILVCVPWTEVIKLFQEMHPQF